MVFVLNSFLHLMNKYVKQILCLHPREQSMSYSHFKISTVDLRNEEHASRFASSVRYSHVVNAW